jgi:two-component system, NarL family, sensor kinase
MIRRDPEPGSGFGVVARPVIQFAAIGIAALVIVGLATAASSRRVGEREAVSDARTNTLVKAQGLVEPLLTEDVVDGDAAAVGGIDDVVRDKVLDRSLVRVKIWTSDGTIAYSDAADLIGEQYDLGEDEREAITSGLIEAEVSDLDKPENRLERDFGKLLEVYLPIRTPSGDRLLFEAYYRYDSVEAAGRRIWRSFAPISLGALAVLELLQIPLAWSLARRLRQRQQERQRLLQRTVEASDVERRRIASDLHDGVVQDLAGVSFELAGAAREPGLPPDAARLLDAAAASVRSNITALRSMLIEIYPPDLAALGLGAALEELAASMSTTPLTVDVELDDLPSVGDETAAVLYRTAREALRNVTNHAAATRATVRAGQTGTTVWLSVTDDGDGFDTAELAAVASEGHFGVRGLEGLARDVGGTFRVESAPGAGTMVVMEVPAE